MKAGFEIAYRHQQIDDLKLPRDEPCFFLRGQDVLAADVVLIWASLAESRGTPAEKVAEARALAAQMKAWPVKQVPGLPLTRVRIHRDGEQIEDIQPEGRHGTD